MKQEQKELLLKDLCARLPYGVKCAYFNTKDEIKVGELLTVWCKEKRVFIDKLSIDYDGGDYVGVIPYLFPLSSMTEEQKQYLKNRFCYDWNDEPYDLWICQIEIGDIDELIDWFHKNHFDYRGLIHMGLAIDATGLNIY